MADEYIPEYVDKAKLLKRYVLWTPGWNSLPWLTEISSHLKCYMNDAHSRRGVMWAYFLEPDLDSVWDIRCDWILLYPCTLWFERAKMMEKDVANEAKQHSPWVSEQRDAQILGLSVKIVLEFPKYVQWSLQCPKAFNLLNNVLNSGSELMGGPLWQTVQIMWGHGWCREGGHPMGKSQFVQSCPRDSSLHHWFHQEGRT